MSNPSEITNKATDDSHEISYLIFFFKLGKMSQNLSSVAVLIGALRVKNWNLGKTGYFIQ